MTESPVSSVRKLSPLTKKQSVQQSTDEEPREQQTEALLREFLSMLKSHSVAFEYLLNESYRLRVLQRSSTPRELYASPRRLEKPGSAERFCALVPATEAHITASASAIGSRNRTARAKSTVHSGRTQSTRKLLHDNQTRASGIKTSDIGSHSFAPVLRDAMGRLTKVYYIDPAALEPCRDTVLERYREICGLAPGAETRTARLSAERCRAWLERRYPAEMVETMMRLLDFTTSKSPVQYYADVERLVTLRDERLLQASFEMFDFDKDHLITTKDAFRAIQARLFDTYDSDLVKLKLILKTKRAVHRTTESEARTSAEGISYGEFRRIEFVGNRPQLAVDLIRWISGVNILELGGFMSKRPKITREDSDTMLLDPSHVSTPYLKSLVETNQHSALSLYSEETRCALLARFQELQSAEVQSSIITETSFSAGFVRDSQTALFGASSPYLSSRLYDLLCRPDGKDLTRLRFLEGLKPLISADPYQQSRFIFDVIDCRCDGTLTGDEVDAFLAEIPQRCALFAEVML